jgi:hypothetical protein
MNEKNSNIRILLVVVVILLPLTIALMFLFKDIVRVGVVIPLSYAAWLAGYLIRSTPQLLYWIVFIFFGFILAVQSLSGVAKNEPGHGEGRVRYSRRERVSFWLTQLYYSRQGYLRTRFTEFFGRLVTEVLAFREQVSTLEVEKLLRDGEMNAPPEIISYFKDRQISFPERERRGLIRLIRKFVGLQGDDNPGSRKPDPQQQIEAAIRFLEDQLEVKNDR